MHPISSVRRLGRVPLWWAGAASARRRTACSLGTARCDMRTRPQRARTSSSRPAPSSRARARSTPRSRWSSSLRRQSALWALAPGGAGPYFHDPSTFLLSVALPPKFGIDRLSQDRRCASPGRPPRRPVAHPASVTSDLATPSTRSPPRRPRSSAAFGPQHGMRGDKQDNMIETADFDDPSRIPVFSLYGEVRRPTREMLDTFDVCSSTCRTSAAASTPSSRRCSTFSRPRRSTEGRGVLDRPNPAGRPVEGSC